MKGDKTNKATELLYSLSLSEDFALAVKTLRRHFKIPTKGFESEETRLLWVNQMDPISFMASVLDLLKTFRIPVIYYGQVSHYIQKNQLDNGYRQHQYVAAIDPYAHQKWNQSDEDLYKETGQPFVKVLIFGNNSKAAVHDFIDRNWTKIQNILEEQGDDPKKRTRKKATENKARDRLIVELSRMTLKEFGANKHKLSKSMLIRARLEKLGYGIVDDGYIRKIISKYK